MSNYQQISTNHFQMIVYITTDISDNIVQNVVNEYGMNRYVYRNSDKIVITDKEQPSEFYESYPNTNN